jgi:hypothetical protein
MVLKNWRDFTSGNGGISAYLETKGFLAPMPTRKAAKRILANPMELRPVILEQSLSGCCKKAGL